MVVISFDSPGGDVAGTLAVADEISGLSAPTAGLVKVGAGGTVVMIAAVDRIYFSPGGLCGAASFGVPPGAPEALQNIQSHVGSKVKRYAEANGHASDVFLALTDENAELVRDAKVWKRRGEIMTLTAQEAHAIGLSVGTLASPEEIIAKEKNTEAN
jgi:membrane-bound ClpP family serine protease